jgi:hypothetical protein
MSNRASQGYPPSLVQVLKLLAREWRVISEDATAGMNGVPALLRHPIRTLFRLVEDSTRIPTNDLEWVAYYSDTPPELTPRKVPGAPFIWPNNDPELDGLLEDYATGQVLHYLRTIHTELEKCDVDGRTDTILNHLEAKHSGLLARLGIRWPQSVNEARGGAGAHQTRSEQAEAANAGREQAHTERAGKRGRPTDTDPKADKKISDAWRTDQYKTYADLAGTMRIPTQEVKHAIDRNRKREERSSIVKRRTNSPNK